VALRAIPFVSGRRLLRAKVLLTIWDGSESRPYLVLNAAAPRGYN
jgi:hypothetical protein